MKKESYNVNDYTDIELYDILDVVNPSDRELEAKIIFLYNRYNNMQSTSGNELAKFFKDVHERFFEIEESEDEYIDEEEEEETNQENFEDYEESEYDESEDEESEYEKSEYEESEDEESEDEYYEYYGDIIIDNEDSEYEEYEEYSDEENVIEGLENMKPKKEKTSKNTVLIKKTPITKEITGNIILDNPSINKKPLTKGNTIMGKKALNKGNTLLLKNKLTKGNTLLVKKQLIDSKTLAKKKLLVGKKILVKTTSLSKEKKSKEKKSKEKLTKEKLTKEKLPKEKKILVNKKPLINTTVTKKNITPRVKTKPLSKKDINKPQSDKIEELSKTIDKLKESNENKKNEISFSKPLEYAQDKLNPLLQQTVKRIISIDSQYRDDKTSLSTDFTFNLSEVIKDVVSLKLYSIQIPHTWYTVSTNFGCNFFFLKGKSPGINDGNFDYKIDISAGNYTAPNLINALNTKIQELKTTTTDVSFGETQILYNPNTALSTIEIDFNKKYNETSYYLYFPTWTNPNSTLLSSDTNNTRYQSIPGFLGYNYNKYYNDILVSTSNLPLTTNSVSVQSDAIEGQFYIDGSNNTNNYFTVIRYIGPGEYSDKSIIDLSFNIEISLNGVVTRNQLLIELSNQLASNLYLSSETSIKREDITDISLNGYGYSYYKLKLKFNRYTTNNIENAKTYIIFPQEIASSTYNNIWTGSTSCFRFKNNTNELNNISTETATVDQQSGKYKITTNPYIYLKCTKPGYDIINNDYKFILANSLPIGYTLSQYITSVNNAMIETNNTTITSKDINGDFTMKTTTSYIDTNTYFNVEIDLNKTFITDMYYLDVTGTIMQTIFNLSGDYLNGILDLSGTDFTFKSSFDENTQYFVDVSYVLFTNPSRLNYGNQDAGDFNISASSLQPIYYTYEDLQNAINNLFNTYTDIYGTLVYSGSNIYIDANEATRMLDITLQIKIKKNLLQTDYKIGFYDYNWEYNTDYNLVNNSTWYFNLNIDKPYLCDENCTNGGVSLSTISNSNYSYTTIKGKTPIAVNVISFTDNINNFFYIKPYEYGVASNGGENDIKFTIPTTLSDGITKIYYTRDNLIIALNTALNVNSLTTGSSISLYTGGNNTYSKIRLNINKIYSAVDYNVVFYDQTSFMRCYTGVKSVTNTTWDTTIGWLIGFHDLTTYALSDYRGSGSKISILSDTTVSVNLYNYFLLCIDDYNPNHLNDGLITLTSNASNIALPSYANKSNYTCDPVTGLLTYNTTNNNTNQHNKLTQNQIYSLTEIANNKRVSTIISNSGSVNAKSYGSGPFVKDVFGIIPMKTAGLDNGSVYVDYGGTLQNQERAYFGPVNINKMSVKLVSDRGDTINLNGSNWSFSLICEQLYQKKPVINTPEKK